MTSVTVVSTAKKQTAISCASLPERQLDRPSSAIARFTATGKTTSEPRTQSANDTRHRSSSFAAGSMNVNAVAHCRARPPTMSA
eukprot:scaffold37999_cov60-Phaeocystis_antarctica.AAC.10